MWILNATTYTLSAVPSKAPLPRPSRTSALIPITGVRRSKLPDDQDGNTSRHIRACKFVFHTSCVLDKVNFLFAQWTNLADSVNLRGACDADHVNRLSAVSNRSFDTACTAKCTVRK